MAEQGKFYGKQAKAIWVGTGGKPIEYAPVVQCKDCKHYKATGYCMRSAAIKMRSDDFCSYGERREGE